MQVSAYEQYYPIDRELLRAILPCCQGCTPVIQVVTAQLFLPNVYLFLQMQWHVFSREA
jgi:hypothetical protein